MSTSIPSDASKANCDATSDDPEQALLTDLADLVDAHNDLLDQFGAAALLNIGAGFDTTSQASGTPDDLKLKIATTAKTGAFTLAESDRAQALDCSNGSWTAGVTAAATLGDGWYCLMRNTGAGTITLDPNVSELVNGVTTLGFGPGVSFILCCTGTAFLTFGMDVLASPTFTGVPAAPTAAQGTDTTQIATTEYVQTELDNLGTSSYTSGNYLLWPVFLSTIFPASNAKTLELKIQHAGTVKTRIGMKWTGVSAIYARVYVNGGAVGSLRSHGSGTWVFWNQDIAVSAGDLLQLYTYGGDGKLSFEVAAAEVTDANAHIDYNTEIA